jgi:hypothetical protein
MKTHPIALLLLVLAGPAHAAAPAAKGRSDLIPPDRRQITVELARELTRVREPAPLPPDFQHPFNPATFEPPEPGTVATAVEAGPAPPPRPPADREILELLAARLTPSGSIIFGGAPQLIMGAKRFPVGTRFTVTYDNRDYELELVTIDRTTFTLRYRGEEITRSITRR